MHICCCFLSTNMGMMLCKWSKSKVHNCFALCILTHTNRSILSENQNTQLCWVSSKLLHQLHLLSFRPASLTNSSDCKAADNLDETDKHNCQYAVLICVPYSGMKWMECWQARGSCPFAIFILYAPIWWLDCLRRAVNGDLFVTHMHVQCPWKYTLTNRVSDSWLLHWGQSALPVKMRRGVARSVHHTLPVLSAEALAK